MTVVATREAALPLISRPLGWALFVFLLLTLVTFVDYRHQSNRLQAAQLVQFETLSSDVREQIKERLKKYEMGLQSTRGAMVSAGIKGISRQKFIDYIQTFDLKSEFPGARGFGFIRRVSAEQDAAFLKLARADGKPDFTIKQLKAQHGERWVIQYIEPLAENLPALGLDVATEPGRNQAVQQAMLTGKAQLSSPITLVQASGAPNRGFLFLLPVYEPGWPLESSAERERAAYGLAYAPLVIDEVLADFKGLDTLFSIALEVVSDNRPADRFYQSKRANQAVTGTLVQNLTIPLYGVEWQAQLKALPLFLDQMPNPDQRVRAGVLLGFSLILSSLVYAFSVIARGRRQIRLAQAHMAAIVTDANDAVVGMNLQGVVNTWNKAAESIFAYSSQEALGRTLSELCVPQSEYAGFSKLIERVLLGQVVAPVVAAYQRKGGATVEVEVTLSPIQGESKGLMGLSATIRDLTELNRTKALFELAVKDAPVAMLLVDREQRISLCNQKACELFDYRAEVLTGMRMNQLMPEALGTDNLAQPENDFSQSISRIMAAGREIWALSRSGTKIFVEIGLSPLPGSEDGLVLVSLLDMTSRRALEQQLEDALNRTRMATDASGVGVWEWSLRNNVLTWDAHMLTIYGVTQKPAGSTFNYADWLTFIHPEDRNEFEQRLLNFVETGGTYEAIYRIVRPDGEMRWTKASALIERDFEGNMLHVVGTIGDITDMMSNQARIQDLNTYLEKKVEERTANLQVVIAELEAFSYSVSHDLRAPLRAIDGFSNILMTSYADKLDATAHGFLDRIRLAAQRMGITIDDLLALARITRTVLEAEDVDLSRMASEVVSTLKDQDPLRVCDVHIQADMHEWADPAMMRIVLTNLIGNAWKFTSNSPHALIKFGAQMREGHLEYFVRDNGAGFDMAYSGKLFLPFQRLHHAQDYPGSGIGLATVQRVLSRHAGGIRAVGKVGAGASFFFWLGAVPKD